VWYLNPEREWDLYLDAAIRILAARGIEHHFMPGDEWHHRPAVTLGGRTIGPRHMHFLVAVDQALVPVEPLQFHAGRRQAKEAHAAVH
jgi:hypothetical protein